MSQSVASLSAEEKRALLAQMLAKKASQPKTAPTSFAQERMWLLQQLNPDSIALNLPLTLRMTGQLDQAALQRSLNEIVRRHATLRTALVAVDGQPTQIITPNLSVPLHVVDLRELAKADRAAKAHAVLNEATLRTFDLTQAPLMRALLLQLDGTDFTLHLVLHHTICDGWSMTVLARELSVLYEAFTAGRSSPLPDLAIQYADFCRWQREWLHGDELAEQLAYWREQLQGSPPILELPIDHPRPSVQAFHGERVSGALSADLVKSLKALSQQAGATLFMTLLAAFQVLLSRLSGQEDIPVGSPIAGRTRAEVDGLIGVFINNLVLRTNLSGNPTFRELLARVRAVSLNAYAHQELPFEKIVEDLQPERSLSHTPLFQVMFNMLSFGLAEVNLPGLAVEFTTPPETGTNFDLTLYCVERENRLELLWVYNADLFEALTIQRMSGHFQTLLAGIVTDPDRSLAALPIFSEAERQRRTFQSNQVRLTTPFVEFQAHEIQQSIASRFEQQATAYPQNVAVRTRRSVWTYDLLRQKVNQVSQAILAVCGGPNERVALLLEHDAPMIAAMLGALQAGKTYVPLDPAYPQARQAYILEDSQASAILTNHTNQALAQSLNSSLPLINLDAISSVSSVDVPDITVAPETPAYILYTSGSTGQPKGVVQSHRNVLYHIRNYTNNLHISAADRLTLLASYSFDAAVMDIFGALLNGATLCPFDAKQTSLQELAGCLQEQGVTIYHSTPTLYRYFMDSLAADQQFPSVRLVVLGGEEVLRPDVEAYQQHFGSDCVFVNGLGPTESTLALQYFIDHETDVARNTVPVGYPIEGTEVMLLNEARHETAFVGEIAIKSAHLALEYWRRPEITQTAFLPDPHDHEKRIYRTGDLGRLLPDGSLEFIGRKDFQVKIRGHRVELGEVETILNQHPGVRHSVVVAHEDAPGEKRLVAYSVLTETQPPASGDLRRFLQTKLPDYMLPSAFVFLDTLPLTPNGKVDRRALPAPDAAPLEPESIVDAPRTPVEESLVDIWTRVMGRGQVGIHSNFFEMGGHSLMATQVISRVRQIFKVELPLRSLFETPTVAGLAGQIELALQGERPPQTPPLLSARRDQPLPLSFSQERMWFIHQLQPDSSAYNMGALTRLSGCLKLAALENSFNAIARRHEDLRTTFATVDGQPVQIIDAEQIWHINVIDLRDRPEPDRDDAALRLIRAEARRPFDLQRGPLLRLSLYRVGEDEHLLFVVMHHIISDAWSMGILLRELMTLYNASVADQAATLPALEIQYADFAAWQRQRMTGEMLANQLAYWRNKLAGVAVIDLPTDRPRPVVQSQRGALQSIDLPASLLDSLHRLNQKQGVTLFMTTLAAFQVLVQRYTSQTDVAIGVPIANRHQLAIENLIGTFVNTLVLRTDLTGDPTFNEVLERVRNTALEAFAHQDLSFAQLVAELQPERDTSHSPLFQIMFNVINVPAPTPNLTGLDVTYVEVDRAGAQFDLTCTVINVPDLQRVTISYNTDLFDADTIDRFIQHYEILLKSIVAQPGLHISELPILTEAERRQLLWEWNDTAADYPRSKCVHHLFEEQVDRTPEAVAVISQSLRQKAEERVTYRELNRRANQLARYLVKLGVGPGAYVGISLERSVEMVVGLLSILKAGGAYVPLDPAFPRERLAFMLEDSQVPVLLTQESLVRELPAYSARAICLDVDWNFIAQESGESLQDGATPADLAYILYTSGSTGRPKGVQIPHRALTNFLLSMQREPGLAADDVLVSVTTLSFDIAGLELYLPLITGACAVVVGHEVAADGALLLKALDQYGATVMQATPATWRMLIDSGWTRTPNLKMLCGGEALPRDLANQILERGGTLWNMYGPTETTIWSSTYEVKRDNEPIHLGHPIANTQFYVLDSRLQPTPIGVPGELYIGGDGVARGYLNRPELTAERFLDNPFVTEANGDAALRLYKTGDLARYRANGTIEFLGRADFQVKVRGFRIELGDIEAALLQHPQVRQAVAIAREDRPGDKRLVGYVIPASEVAPTTGELRAFVKERLPDYMVPAAFVILDQFPLTPNGKVDRRALPKPEEAATEPRVYVAPRTALEEAVASIWAQVLKVERVSVFDNFFELGGHSLLATQIVARLRDKLQVEVPLASIFEAPTVAELAERLAAISWAARERSGEDRRLAGDREEIEL